MDDTTTIETLKKMVISFRDERNWEQFHDPKNLAAWLSIESAELQEYGVPVSFTRLVKLRPHGAGRPV